MLRSFFGQFHILQILTPLSAVFSFNKYKGCVQWASQRSLCNRIYCKFCNILIIIIIIVTITMIIQILLMVLILIIMFLIFFKLSLITLTCENTWFSNNSKLDTFERFFHIAVPIYVIYAPVNQTYFWANNVFAFAFRLWYVLKHYRTV